MIKKFSYFLVIILLFSGCENNSKKKDETKPHKEIKKEIIKPKIKNISKPKENKKIIKENNFTLTFVNSKLIYPKNKMVLLFDDGSLYSQEEEKILKKLKITFYKTKNRFLQNYFKIDYYPSIVILDKNQTIIYQNFMPYEMLKTEGF